MQDLDDVSGLKPRDYARSRFLAAMFACRSGQLKVRPQGDRAAAARSADLDLA